MNLRKENQMNPSGKQRQERNRLANLGNRGPTARIEITKGLFVIVDRKNFDWLNQYAWMAWTPKESPRLTYAVRKGHVDEGRSGNTKILMHREIVGAKGKDQVDHEDCNGLNNTEENLRWATHSQNLGNPRKRATKTSSKFKGVTWQKSTNKWQASVQYLGKRFYVGWFKNELDAAKAYNKKAIELFGEYARINVI